MPRREEQKNRKGPGPGSLVATGRHTGAGMLTRVAERNEKSALAARGRREIKINELTCSSQVAIKPRKGERPGHAALEVDQVTSKPCIKAQRQPRGGEKGLGNVLCVFEGQPGVGSWGCVNIGVCTELDVHPSPPKSMSLSYS